MARQATPDIFKDALAVGKAIQDDVKLIMGDPDATPVRRDGIQDVPVGMIDDNPFQPRTDYTGIEELAADIATNGLLQVPKGRRKADGGRRKEAVCELEGRQIAPIFPLAAPFVHRGKTIHPLSPNACNLCAFLDSRKRGRCLPSTCLKNRNGGKSCRSDKGRWSGPCWPLAG